MKYWLFLLLSLTASCAPRPAWAGELLRGTASWYSTETCQYNPDAECPTADGSSLYTLEQFGERFGAMWDVPLGSRVRVCQDPNAFHAKRTCVNVIIRDRGPNSEKYPGRLIDLSREAFRQIGDLQMGIIPVTVEVLKTPSARVWRGAKFQ